MKKNVRDRNNTPRIGHGIDVHKFGGCQPLIIGGVYIPDGMGVLAHSDGDVMIHALIDALLGASCQNDIGTLFPDTKIEYCKIDSRKLLRISWEKIVLKGFSLGNVDITLMLQSPNIQLYIPQMRCHLSEDLNCSMENINIKATTTETLGCIGRSEGIACVAVVLLMF